MYKYTYTDIHTILLPKKGHEKHKLLSPQFRHHCFFHKKHRTHDTPPIRIQQPPVASCVACVAGGATDQYQETRAKPCDVFEGFDGEKSSILGAENGGI